MTIPILTKMVGLETTFQIWEKLATDYTSYMRAQIKKLHVQLRQSKKDDLSTFIFLTSRRLSIL